MTSALKVIDDTPVSEPNVIGRTRARFYFKKLIRNNDLANCWYCNRRTPYALYLPDGSEIWACSVCLAKHGKIKKFKRLMNAELRSLKILANSNIKNDKNAILEVGVRVK